MSSSSKLYTKTELDYTIFFSWFQGSAAIYWQRQIHSIQLFYQFPITPFEDTEAILNASFAPSIIYTHQYNFFLDVNDDCQQSKDIFAGTQETAFSVAQQLLMLQQQSKSFTFHTVVQHTERAFDLEVSALLAKTELS